jgi:hypothetical protein
MSSIRPPSDVAVLSARLQDGLTLFLEHVANVCDVKDTGGIEPPDQRVILCRFVEALGRVLMDCPLVVVWEAKRQTLGASLGSLDGKAAPMGPDEARAAIAAFDWTAPDERRDGPRTIAWSAGKYGVEAIRISTDMPRGSLWILRAAKEQGTPAWRWFHAYLPGLRSLFVTLRALMETRAAADGAVRRSRLEEMVKGLSQHRSKDITKRLQEATALLDELLEEDEIECLDLVEELAVSTLQELLGTGWAVRAVGKIDPDRGNAPDDGRAYQSGLLGLAVSRFEDAVERAAAGRGGEGPERARLGRSREHLGQVARCFRALLALDDAGGEREPRKGDEAIHLLPMWTRVHEVCRALCRPRRSANRDYIKALDAWHRAAGETLRLLAQHLEIVPRSQPLSQPEAGWRRGPTSARNWLSLWFCLLVLRARSAEFELDDPESCLLRADLAYVLRESLRFACFGARPDYFFQPATYAAALRRLVEYHAHAVVGLPREYNLARLLDEVGSHGGLNRYSAAEHLQHVLEIYIGGHFLLSVRLSASAGAPESSTRWPDQPPGSAPSTSFARQGVDGFTVAEALISAGVKPSAERTGTLMQAFSLAALFHDVGHILFPSEAIPQQSLAWDDDRIAEALLQVKTKVGEAGDFVAVACLRDLQSHYFGDDEVDRFRGQLALRGEPNHALLSAWYLHRVGTGVLARLEDGEGLRQNQSESLKMAVRAVLLHGASREQVRADRDPSAVLLILLNEVFEWDRTRHLGPAPSTIGRSFHVMAADVPPREPRDRWIRIRGLEVRVGASGGGLDATLEIGGAGAPSHWPEIQIGLQVPQRLDVPVFRLWLSKAQNLGRIVSTSAGFGPTVVMESIVDVSLSTRGLTTKQLLELVAESRELTPIRPALRAWLSVLDRFASHDRPTRREETVRLGPMRLPLALADEWLSRIEEEAWEVVRAIDADGD